MLKIFFRSIIFFYFFLYPLSSFFFFFLAFLAFRARFGVFFSRNFDIFKDGGSHDRSQRSREEEQRTRARSPIGKSAAMGSRRVSGIFSKFN